ERNPWSPMLSSPTHRARRLRARLPNNTAPTPSTRLPPRGLKLKFFELNCPTPSSPLCLVPERPWLVVPLGLLAVVLVLARPSAREDGTLSEPARSRICREEMAGEPKETPGLRGNRSVEQPG